MTDLSRRVLFWAPRALTIAFIAFISIFALDVFGSGLGFWRTLGALLMHLIPTFVLIAALAVAWRRDWLGAALFGAAGIWFLVIVRPNWESKLLIATPEFVVAALFLANWLTREKAE